MIVSHASAKINDDRNRRFVQNFCLYVIFSKGKTVYSLVNL